ncbi:MAG TPA: glycosyltransferase [Bacillota bacterium]|nr:glycosyltransferase [Bacillota bacterium]
MKQNVMHLFSAWLVGGAEKLLINFLKSAQDNQADVNFVVVVLSNMIDENLKEELLSIGYEVYFLNKKKGAKNTKYLGQILEIVKKNQIGIIHSHDYGSKMWSILCKMIYPTVKLVHTIHRTNVINELNYASLLLCRLFVNVHIAISEVILAECLNRKIKRVVKIHNGIDIQKFLKNPLPDFNPNQLRIINISRLRHHDKGQDVLIKALKVCKEKGIKFTCNMVGGAYSYDAQSPLYLKKLVDELDLNDEAHFLGHRNDIPELLGQHDLFILPSRVEGFGLVILEAMAAGVPVIASNIDGPKELIEPGQNGLLFENENFEDLAEKIIYCREHITEMADISRRAREYVKQFDISMMAKQYFALYRGLLQ